MTNEDSKLFYHNADYAIFATSIKLVWYSKSTVKLIGRIKKHIPTPIKRALGQYLMKILFLRGKQPVEVRDGRKFRVIEDRLFLPIMLNKEYEADLSSIAAKLIQEGDNVVDVGANFGWYTTLFTMLVGQSGSVHSFEPFPKTFEVLQSNVLMNNMAGTVTLNNVSVGEVAGEALMVCDGINNSGLAHVTTDLALGVTKVGSVRLDDTLIELEGRISYLKIDIEGFEFKALSGMPRLLNSVNPPIIQIELNDEALQRASGSRQEVVSLLSTFHYQFYTIDPNNPDCLVKSDAVRDSDVFCMPPGRFAERILRLCTN